MVQKDTEEAEAGRGPRVREVSQECPGPRERSGRRESWDPGEIPD